MKLSYLLIGILIAIFGLAILSGGFHLEMSVGNTTHKSTLPTPQPSETSVTQPSSNFLTYDNTTYRIRIKYPSEWTKSEGISGLTVAFLSPIESSSDNFRENLNVIVGNFTQSMTLDEYIDFSINQLKKEITDFSIIDSSATTLAGNPAHKIIFTGTISGKSGNQGQFLKWMQVYTIKNNRSYVITYCAEVNKHSYFLDTIQKMINSFEIY